MSSNDFPISFEKTFIEIDVKIHAYGRVSYETIKINKEDLKEIAIKKCFEQFACTNVIVESIKIVSK